MKGIKVIRTDLLNWSMELLFECKVEAFGNAIFQLFVRVLW